ncbi:GNAT family N-acetyltransferase [Allokutzneria multivorans]|uniref:GNAT family N-acetyltransferase n=1 Tax=Allokutzneria multivorans TaxID=1142134 RepID=A0ABP7SRP8_9PSEU
MSVRRIQPSDVDSVVRLVHALAEYEKAPQECHLTSEQLHASLFGAAPAVFGHVAEVDGEVVGYCLWFLSYSTWRGTHGIYMEDLYVDPARRGSGLGKALLVELARECVSKGYQRLEWSVLKWNTPAIDFYKSVGAFPMDEWEMHRLTDAALTDFAAKG